MTSAVPDVAYNDFIPKQVYGGRKSKRDELGKLDGYEAEFQDVFGEPTGTETPEIIWDCIRESYRVVFKYAYVLLSVILGPILAIAWAIIYAVFVFVLVWIVSPSTRLWEITFSLVGKLVRPIMTAVCVPIFQSISYAYSAIKVRYIRYPDKTKEQADDIVIRV